MKKTDFSPQNQDSTILDKSPWDSTAIFIFFCHFSVRSLLKQCIIFEIFLQFSVALPYTKLKLGKILDTRVQHCLWDGGRGWTCVNWKMPQKRKRVPKLLSMIVDVNTNLLHLCRFA